jgi:hypothetical protein
MDNRIEQTLATDTDHIETSEAVSLQEELMVEVPVDIRAGTHPIPSACWFVAA